MEERKHEERKESDRFNSLMFGPGRQPQRDHQTQEAPHQQSTIDYEELMNNIDALMESMKGFKPLFQKVYPYIEQLWKKNKADS
ncbi:hypothetical protein ABES03_06300 [Neobacillus rhizosphaerae]|uniref:hypothetical protein n=1 Tax=Neobacillus rhizosphaerae TaxID=2880965 RepID=UPI003D2C5BE9